MARPSMKKLQKELARKEKKELKRQRKINKNTGESEIHEDQTQETIESSETA